MANNIFKLFLIIILIIGSLNFVYANGGPNIGPNQAKTIVKDYLNFHNISYTKITVNDDMIKVKDNKTGEIKWVKLMDFSSDNGNNLQIENVPTVWIAHIKNNGNEIGQVYVDDETGEISKVIINGKVLVDIFPKENRVINYTAQDNNTPQESNVTNTSQQVSQNSLDTTTAIILAIASILVISGVVYWFKSRK